MKWEPVAAMIILFLLGVWVVIAPTARHDLRPGAKVDKLTLPGLKGELEVMPKAEKPGDYDFRVLYRDGEPTRVITHEEFVGFFGQPAYDTVTHTISDSFWQRNIRSLFNITSWQGVIWVTIGMLGQAAFFGRMLVQWLVSEKKKQSVIPEAFWWLSLLGGVMLFAYGAWRQDIVVVLGQTSGVVIYARNIRLIHKQAKRAARQAERERQAQMGGARETGGAGMQVQTRPEAVASLIHDPAPEPTSAGV